MQQLTLPVGLRDDATFDNFFVATANRELVHVLHTIDASAGFDCLLLYGASGSGRSHLLQAVCHAAQVGGGSALYLPLIDVIDCDPRGLLEMAALPDVVCVDDIDRAVDSRLWQESLFHLYNRLHGAGGALLAAAPVAPAALRFTLADLASRLAGARVYRLAALDDAGKRSALQLRAGRRGLVLDDGVARYLLEHMPRGWPVLMDALDRLDRASLVERHRLTLPFVRRVLAGMLG